MKQPNRWAVVREGEPWTPEEDAERLDLVGWLWSAPPSVKRVETDRIAADMATRTMRRKP